MFLPFGYMGPTIKLKCFHCGYEQEVPRGQPWPRCCKRTMYPAEWGEPYWHKQEST